MIRILFPQTKQATANAQTRKHRSSKLPRNEIRLNAKLMEQDDEALNSVVLKVPLSSTPCCLRKALQAVCFEKTSHSLYALSTSRSFHPRYLRLQVQLNVLQQFILQSSSHFESSRIQKKSR